MFFEMTKLECSYLFSKMRLGYVLSMFLFQSLSEPQRFINMVLIQKKGVRNISRSPSCPCLPTKSLRTDERTTDGHTLLQGRSSRLKIKPIFCSSILLFIQYTVHYSFHEIHYLYPLNNCPRSMVADSFIVGF